MFLFIRRNKKSPPKNEGDLKILGSDRSSMYWRSYLTISSKGVIYLKQLLIDPNIKKKIEFQIIVMYNLIFRFIDFKGKCWLGSRN